MIQHSNDPKVFIRSIANRGHLGGLSLSTHEIIDLLQAAGKEIIIIETVGVGQSEVDIVNVADVVLMVLNPDSGDEIQIFKAGIIEIADIFVINKADLGGSDNKISEIRNYFAMSAQDPLIFPTSAKEDQGIDELLAGISAASGKRKRAESDEKSAGHEEKLCRKDRRRTLPGGNAPRPRPWPPCCSNSGSGQSLPAGRSQISHNLKQEAAMIKKIDHIAIAVKNLAEEITRYRDVLGLEYLGTEVVAEQKVTVAFFKISDVFIELLEPLTADSPISAFIEKKGGGLHHLALEVDDIQGAIRRLQEKNVQMLDQRTQERRPPFPDRLCPSQKLFRGVVRIEAAGDES